MSRGKGGGARQAGKQFGAFPSEHAVMNLWDGGLSRDQIAERLGKKRSFVDRVLSYMGDNGSAEREAIRRGSARLIAAIRLAHPELDVGA